MTKLDQFLTIADAAKRVGVTTTAVYARIDSGKLPEHRMLNRRVVAVKDVNMWIAERKAGAK